MINRLPTYFLSMQQQPTTTGSGTVNSDAVSASTGDAPLGSDGVVIKVNVKQLNRDYEHNLNDEISLIIGDAQTNQLLFHKVKL